MPAAATKESRFNLRTTAAQRSIIERGAAVQGQKLTDFVVSSACEKAEHVLADQRSFVVPREKWDRFVAALDRPTTHKPRLARLMSEPSILER
jgi:uncharacterized protein (DUF1778 family)